MRAIFSTGIAQQTNHSEKSTMDFAIAHPLFVRQKLSYRKSKSIFKSGAVCLNGVALPAVKGIPLSAQNDLGVAMSIALKLDPLLIDQLPTVIIAGEKHHLERKLKVGELLVVYTLLALGYAGGIIGFIFSVVAMRRSAAILRGDRSVAMKSIRILLISAACVVGAIFASFLFLLAFE
jgi:hypothetical protein